MPKKQISFDKTEIVAVFLSGKSYKVQNLSYEDIRRIQIDRSSRRRIFGSELSEKITIETSKELEPIVYEMHKNARFWDEYKQGFTRFAQYNHITFVDNTR